jgi:hypothetical protein
MISYGHLSDFLKSDFLFHVHFSVVICLIQMVVTEVQGRIQGGAHPARGPPKIGKKKYFGVKSWFFTRNTQTNFAPPSAIGRNMIFWRKIVIFHTKYPKHFRASLRSVQFFQVRPLTWNPGSAPVKLNGIDASNNITKLESFSEMTSSI